jgi:outer membrane lipoprotein
MKTISVLFGTLLFMQSCTYAISPSVANKAAKNIPFEKLQADLEAFTGTLFVLGGTIVQTMNTKQGTVIEVDQKKLDYWGKPERTRRSGGKFLVFYPGFLDPLVFASGRDITVAGEVLEPNTPVLGGQRSDLVVIRLQEHRLWEQERPSWNRPQWFDPLYDTRNAGPGMPE